MGHLSDAIMTIVIPHGIFRVIHEYNQVLIQESHMKKHKVEVEVEVEMGKAKRPKIKMPKPKKPKPKKIMGGKYKPPKGSPKVNRKKVAGGYIE